MKKKKISKTALFLILSVTIIIGLILAGLFAFYQVTYTAVNKENSAYFVEDVKQLAEDVDESLMDGFKNIEIISELVSSSIDSPEVDIRDWQNIIQDSVFDFIEFADPQGLDHNITGETSDARDRTYYKDGMAGNTGVELIMESRATQETLLMFYTPVYYEETIVGSVVGVYQASNMLTDALTVKYYGEIAPAYLCSEDGIVVASSVGVDTTKKINITDVVAKDDKELALKITDSFKTGSDLLYGAESIDTTTGYVTKLPNSGFYLVQTFPDSVSKDMVSTTTDSVIALVAFLAVVYAIIIISIIIFYKKQRDLVERANRAKTDFLFNMSHDIRTPMNAITGYGAMAKEHIDDKKSVSDYLDKINIASKQLLSLVNEVLDMSRIESGKVVLEEEEVDLTETCNSILTVIETSAEKKHITVKGDFDDIRNKDVYTDASRLTQIITNILSNSVKYTLDGGKIFFTVSQLEAVRPRYNTYKFVIEDTGIGMSEEFLTHIYDEFARERNTTMSGVEGTGLGMSIVKRIVDLMDGRIEVESKQGVGTKTTIFIEFRLHHAKDDAYLPNLDDEVKSIDGMRVLLVEDNEMNREIAADLLSEEGVIVEMAEDGDIAVAKVAESEPGYYNVVLMDIQMPRMNGYDATRAIRALSDPNLSKIPIVAMTANAFEEDKRNALEAGMNGHLAKPIDMVLVKKTLSKYRNK